MTGSVSFASGYDFEIKLFALSSRVAIIADALRAVPEEKRAIPR